MFGLDEHELPFSSPATENEPDTKNSSDVDQSHENSTDTVEAVLGADCAEPVLGAGCAEPVLGAGCAEPVLGAGCAELYPEVERPSNPHLDESTNIASSSSSGLKDITRPGTPMPGRVSRKSSSHDPESRDLVEILQQALGPGEDRLSDTEMPSDVAFSLRTRLVFQISQKVLGLRYKASFS